MGVRLRSIRILFRTVLLTGTIVIVPLISQLLTGRVSAASSLQAAPRISFTFDDGLASTYNLAQPTLAKYGLTGTDYVISGCVGMSTLPNTCRANTSYAYMTWSQIQSLQNSDGWEIGSHTVDHKCLASNASVDPSDCQTNTLTKAQVDAELANSQSALASNGITATDFAPPYGDYNNTVLAEIAKYYASMRNFRNDSGDTNSWPYSDYYLWDYVVQEGITPVSAVEAAVDKAVANNQWLILTFHEIRPTPSTNPDDYQYGSAELDQIAAYVQSKQAAGAVQSIHINQGLVTGGTNLLPNASFDSGIAGGWHTDSPSGITADVNSNGSYPSATNSIKLVSSSTSEHLFSPLVSVTPGTTYMLKSFLNVQNISSGEVGYYIDEYDANNNWISGQWKTGENSPFVEDMNFTYKPTSASVSKASLQIYTTASTGITAYTDNAQWFVAATQPQPNLVANGCFADGITDGWHTDDTNDLKADNANNGDSNCAPTSVFLQSPSSSNNSHLFSPLVAVSPGSTYSISSWLNLKQLTNSGGEVGYYVDEYDANNNWISGQYKLGVKTLGASSVNISYKPSSSQVSKASLQIIDVGSAGIQAYFDDVKWYVSN